MNCLKRGFSLAELLLTVGIIGVITAMGMTITKHAADNAYRGYWYTGYINLSNMIADFEKYNLFEAAPDPNSDMRQINRNANDFARELGRLLGVNSQNNSVTARNGINYSVAYRGPSAAGDDYVYVITMTVPQAKTRQNPDGTATADIAYMHDEGLLVPMTTGGVDLQNRRDLLPTYFDQGIQNNNRIRTSSSRIYQSYNASYCNNHNAGLDKNGVSYINCPGGSPDNPGIIKVVNPSKIR